MRITIDLPGDPITCPHCGLEFYVYGKMTDAIMLPQDGKGAYCFYCGKELP